MDFLYGFLVNMRGETKGRYQDLVKTNFQIGFKYREFSNRGATPYRNTCSSITLSWKI